jgi:hypothetical protein
MHSILSNTKQGPIVVVAGDNLTAKEGYLVKVSNASGVAKAYLPAAAADAALYLVLEGGAAGANVTLHPLSSDRNVRVVAKSTTLVAGDKVIAYASGAEGMLTEYASGDAFIVGVCEEVGDTEGQQVLIRPVLSWLNGD